MCVDLRITSVEHGWIFGELSTPEGQIGLANSYLGGEELPKVLFQALYDLLCGSTESKWICWHGESECCIWHMQCTEQGLKLRVFEGGGSFGLPVQDEDLACKAQKARQILEVDTDVYAFAASVCDGFAEYAGEVGKKKWQTSRFGVDFPEKEYRALRKQLRRK